MLMPLTPVQVRVFNELARLFQEKQFPPTSREVADLVGKRTVSNEFQALIKKGWVKKLEGQHVRNNMPTDEALERWEKEKRDA